MDADLLLREINKSWSGQTANWANLSKSYNAAIICSTPYKAGQMGWFTFDVTQLIEKFVVNPKTNFGAMLFSDNEVTNTNSGSASKFYNFNHSDKTLRPKLTVTYNDNTSIHSTNKTLQTGISVSCNVKGLTIRSVIGRRVRVQIFTLKGSPLNEIDNLTITAGTNHIPFQNRLPQGVYISKITSQRFLLVKQFLLH